MPWRLIGFVILFGILLVFIGLNVENRCDVSFGFATIKAAPIYLTAFSAFVLGLLCAVPLSISLRGKKAPASREEKPRRLRARKKKGNEPAPGGISPEEGGDLSGKGDPYGID